MFAPGWFADWYARSRRPEPEPAGTSKRSPKAQREFYQAEKEGLLVEKLRRQLDDGWVSREDHIGDFREIGDCLRTKGDLMCLECRELQNQALEDARSVIERRYVDDSDGEAEAEAGET